MNKTIKEKAAQLTACIEENAKPEFIRLPLPGKRCPFTGLSRSTLNELTIDSDINDHKAPVKSHVLKKRGAMRGIRLISFDSLMNFLNGLPSNVEAI